MLKIEGEKKSKVAAGHQLAKAVLPRWSEFQRKRGTGPRLGSGAVMLRFRSGVKLFHAQEVCANLHQASLHAGLLTVSYAGTTRGLPFSTTNTEQALASLSHILTLWTVPADT
jgi:hypothetical protein